MSHPPVWVLADPRAGTAAQALGIAERLGIPFRTVTLAWSAAARLPLRWPTLLGLGPEVRDALRGPPPRLVLAAGRRAAPAALWLGRRGAATVHCMRPGFAHRRFALLVLGQHDEPAAAPNVLPILGATHRLSPARLAAARAEWSDLATLPAPRVALLVGGPVRGTGLSPALAAELGRAVAGSAGSVLATTSRRTGAAAEAALSAALAGVPHRLHRWGDPGPNPYAGLLAHAEAVVVTGDSVSMLSEALATAAPVFVAELPAGPRHRRLWNTLYAARQARPLSAGVAPFARTALDETGRVAAAVTAMLPELRETGCVRP